MSSISYSSSVFKLNVDNLSRQLLGLDDINEDIITSYDDFLKIFKRRHDLIHQLICEVRGVEFGEKPVEEILTNRNVQLVDLTYFDLVKKQTPDYFDVIGGSARIIEISISRSKLMEREKHSKYALLNYFLKRNKLTVDMEVIIINPDMIYRDRDTLVRLHRLNDPTIDLIKKICDNTRALESRLKSTPQGSFYFLQYHEVVDSENPIPVSIQDVLDINDYQYNKITHNKEELLKLLTKPETTYVNAGDNDFIDHCVSLVRKIESDLTKKEKFNRELFLKDIDSMATSDNFDEPRSFMPLPYVEVKNEDSSKRTTEEDMALCMQIASKMQACDDPILSIFGTKFLQQYPKIRNLNQDEKGLPFLCPLTKEQKAFIALEGPNRKHYVKRPDLYPEHVKSHKKYSQYSCKYDMEVQSILPLSRFFSDIEDIKGSDNIFRDTLKLANLDGVGLRYVKFCQSVFREVNINALRKDRRRKFLIRPVGIKGVYVLIYKGAKLRTGELVSQVWFKVIIENSEIISKTIEPIWAFKKLTNHGMISASGWLSTDCHRLDHYLRCYDKIVMSYLTLMSQSYRTKNADKKEEEPVYMNKTLFEAINNDQSNALGMIILIYMEDKRSTSKMIQNVRYLVMTSISIFPYYNSVMDKCKEPVRTPLQLYLLKKMVDYIEKMDKIQLSKQYNYGSVKFDEVNKLFSERYGGASLLLPRVIIDDKYSIMADFTEILSEMYFTMLFNKNQDDPTHASFQILSKMLEGEHSMKEMKNKNMHLGYQSNVSDNEWASEVVQQPHTHKFSKRAIEVGAKLVRERLGDKTGTDIKVAMSKSNINKTIDEFATFKSSANDANLTFRASEFKQNTRVRCIEGVMKLLEEGLKDSFEVAKRYLSKETIFQVFKKNQIGGVREILILNIVSRIKINIIETLSRNICTFDRRETMTHGSTKVDLVKETLFEARKKAGKRMSLFFSFDKSRWGPSFVPSQFIYLFTPFKKELGSMFYYIVSQLMLHQNKKCLLPERLITAWFRDLNNNYEHKRDPLLQKLKEKFLSTKNIFFENESNMGQGILHYTSSYLHSAMISFRDELYKRCCIQEHLDHDDHEDLFSSDDSFTVMSIEIHRMVIVLRKLDLFLKCQSVAERLFNCSTSKAKSSINPFIGEFNSLFMSNMTFYPTLIKFTMAAVHPVNTDSFFRMVKESFASCRQIIENGGTLDLYLIAHQMNKIYAETIYHTHKNGQNDLSLMNIRIKPYQVGEYPIFDPSLMLMFGPEFHNYRIYKNLDLLNNNERKLFINSHKIVKGGLVETLAELEEGDTMLGGLLRIEAHIGPITYLNRIRERSILTKDQISSKIVDDPLLTFKRPQTLDDVIFKTCHKLFIPGAKEALKTIAASIYYGRVSASISANAFYIPNTGYELQTFPECVDKLMNYEKETINIEDHIKFLYPKWPEYEIFVNEISNPVPIQNRNIFEIQSIKQLSIFKVGTRITNPIVDILKYLWMGWKAPEHEENRFLRDVEILKAFYPLIKNTLEETLDQFSGDRSDKMKAIIMLILKLYSLRDRSIKAIVFGESTTDLRDTYYNLTEKNFMLGLSHQAQTIEQALVFNRLSYNKIYYIYNHYVLGLLQGLDDLVRDDWDLIDDNTINMFMMDPTIGKSIKKRIFMPLIFEKKIIDVESWSSRTSVILHYWEVRQKYNEINKTWSGDFDLIVFMGKYKMELIYNCSLDEYKLYKTDFEEPGILFELTSELCELANIKIQDLSNKLRRGDWIIKDSKILFAPKNGFDIILSKIHTPSYSVHCDLEINDDWTVLRDPAGNKIFSLQTGLMNCDKDETLVFDFECFGIQFSKLNENGCFTKGFDIQYKPKRIIKSLLSDLEVPKPQISDRTRIRLDLDDNWETTQYEDIDEVEVVESKQEDVDPMNFFILEKDEILAMNLSWTFDPVYEFISTFTPTDFFNTVQTTIELQFPKKTFRTIKNLKYDCIAMLLTNQGLVNRQTILSISDTLVTSNERRYILYSLISRYDRFNGITGETSPQEVTIRIDNYVGLLGATFKQTKLRI